ncbi:hypothetical protein BQ8420_01665 [Nocardiopsis sp. JB363]|nr:hypothetical protein BQ8420_01665 [Nocardiopsis sp. JB363]
MATHQVESVDREECCGRRRGGHRFKRLAGFGESGSRCPQGAVGGPRT